MSASTMRLVLSFMPQDDVLYLELTVRQSLYYAAMLRCPGHWPFGLKTARAEEIMDTLDMTGVADNLVSAVSGGQRKRVSAAMEFLSDRPLLFLDGASQGTLPTLLCRMHARRTDVGLGRRYS